MSATTRRNNLYGCMHVVKEKLCRARPPRLASEEYGCILDL